MKRSNGTPVPVNYTMRATPQGWKAWDITIEGISYVKNYRTDFGAEIDQKGIDAVIQRLEAQNAVRQAGCAGDDPDDQGRSLSRRRSALTKWISSAFSAWPMAGSRRAGCSAMSRPVVRCPRGWL